MSVCQTGDIVIVSFHGLSLANCLMSMSFKTLSSVVFSWASINGVANRSNMASVMIPLFIA